MSEPIHSESSSAPNIDELSTDTSAVHQTKDATLVPSPSDAATLRVFVSHASKDRADVERIIIRLLKKHGIEFFFSSESIGGADEWHDEILQALNSCSHVIVALTPHAAASKWVRAEVKFAFERLPEGRILPAFIKPCEIERVHLLLKNLQRFDFLGNPAKAAQSLLEKFKVEPRGVSQFLGEDLSQTLFGSVFTGLLLGSLCGASVGAACRAAAIAVSAITDWTIGSWTMWIFVSAAAFAAIGGLFGVFHAAKDNTRLSNLLGSLLEKIFRGALIGVVAWAISWGLGYLGGWQTFDWWRIILFCALGLGVYDLLDTMFMLFERRRLRRLNAAIFLWNTVGVIFVSSVWALAHIGFNHVGPWYIWALGGLATFSVFAAISASIAASAVQEWQ